MSSSDSLQEEQEDNYKLPPTVDLSNGKIKQKEEEQQQLNEGMDVVDSYDDMEKLKVPEFEKNKGKEAFQKQDYSAAVKHYSKALLAFQFLVKDGQIRTQEQMMKFLEDIESIIIYLIQNRFHVIQIQLFVILNQKNINNVFILLQKSLTKTHKILKISIVEVWHIFIQMSNIIGQIQQKQKYLCKLYFNTIFQRSNFKLENQKLHPLELFLYQMFDDARKDLKAAFAIDPTSKEVQLAFEQLQIKKNKVQEKQKQLSKKMLENLDYSDKGEKGKKQNKGQSEGQETKFYQKFIPDVKQIIYNVKVSSLFCLNFLSEKLCKRRIPSQYFNKDK